MDRDLNAAINILKEGINLFNTVGTTEINACGDMSSEVGNSAQEASCSLDN
jgi:transposase